MLSLLAAVVMTVSPDAPLRLAPGAHELLKIPGLQRVAVGKEEIADVVPVTGRPGELLVYGRQLGRTSIMVWTARGVQTRTVIVDDGKSTEVARMVKELVSPGLRVETYNGFTVIDGVIDSVDEMNRLKRLVGEDASVKLLVHLNPRVLPLVAEQMNSAFQKNGLKDARAVCVGQRIFLEGSVADEREMKKAMLIASTYYGEALTPL